MMEEINLIYCQESSSGGVCSNTNKFFIGYSVKPFVDYSGMDMKGTETSINNTINTLGDFNQPQQVAFNYDFWQTLKFYRIIASTLFYTVWGLPQVLVQFGMPSLFIMPMLVLMELSHALTALYITTGKSF